MELVRPWFYDPRRGFSVASEPLEGEIQAVRTTGVVWLSWNSQCDQCDDSLPVFPAEAFHLVALTLAAAENKEDWAYNIADCWPMEWIRTCGDQRLHLGIKLPIDSQFTFSRSCGQFFTNDSALLASEYYKRVRRQLEAMAVDAGRNIDNLSVPVQVCLRAPARDEPDTKFEASLLEILQVASLQAIATRGNDGAMNNDRRPPPLLHLREVAVEGGRKTWSTRSILRLSQILALGVHVNPIDLRGVEVNNETAQYLIPPLQRFCGVSDQLRTIIIETSKSIPSLDAMFSALPVSTSVRELNIKFRRSSMKNRDTRRRIWRWIALVFFSGHASNGIEKLGVDVSALKDSDVATIEQLRRAEDPMASLFCTKSTRRVVTASKFRLDDMLEVSRPVSSPFDSDSEPQTIAFDLPLRDLPVLDGECTDFDGVSVLLPGWGRAWVAAVFATPILPRRATAAALVGFV